MSDSAGLALSLPGSQTVFLKPEALDLTATHRFAFLGQRWFAGVGTCVKGVLMICMGGFLLSQIPSTPQLSVQMAILGSLLSLGGLYFVVRSLGDFLGSLTIDRHGVNARLGLTGFSIPFSDINGWYVNDHSAKVSELAALQIWREGSKHHVNVPGGCISATDLQRVRCLLNSFAPSKERI